MLLFAQTQLGNYFSLITFQNFYLLYLNKYCTTTIFQPLFDSRFRGKQAQEDNIASGKARGSLIDLALSKQKGFPRELREGVSICYALNEGKHLKRKC